MKTSLLITTFNRANLLKHNLERLTQLTIPDEIIVINDGGTDHTASIVESFGKRLPIRYIYNNNPGQTICSHARNIGVKHAEYDWIITCEPELVYITDVVQQLINNHNEKPEDIISAGKIYFAPSNYEPHGEYGKPPGAKVALGWVAPYTALWKKEWLEEINGWDEEFPGPWGWEDIDILTRLRINGHGQYIDQGIEAIHLYHGLGGDKDSINENHFRSKSFIGKGDETKFGEEELRDVVANRNHEWGLLKWNTNSE